MAYSKKISQLLATLQQNNRMLTLSFPNDDVAYADQLVANFISAKEELNRDFEFKVELLSDNPEIILKDMIGKMATVECLRHDGSSRFFNGYIFSFEYISNESGYSRYEMILKPWLAFFQYRKDCKTLQNKTLREITQQYFDQFPKREVQFSLLKEYNPITFSIQFNESDYNYLHRQWEQAGWIYWYEHRKDGHTLRIVDQTLYCENILSKEIVYRANNANNTGVGILYFSNNSKINFNKYSSTSFDFKDPNYLNSELDVAEPTTSIMKLENYEYSGAFAYDCFTEGQKDLVLENVSNESEIEIKTMSCNDAYADVGHWFKLAEFNNDLDEAELEYLIVAITQSAGNNYLFETENKTAQYQAELSCIKRSLKWSAPTGFNSQATYIYGLQTALVVGPAGEEIYTDKFARVKVQFHWDREGKKDENSSAWIRVATSWAGTNFGVVSIPRIGQEVIIQFLDGNPDRPIITGSVYNGDHMPPWDLPENATQSGMLSRSSTGANAENANAIRFEDKKGEEEVWIHAEKNQRIEVENDESHSVGVNRTKDVGKDETVSIGQNRNETVGATETIKIGTDRTETVGKNETITIGANRTETVTGNETININKNRTETVIANETISIGKKQTITIGNRQTISVGSNKLENVAIASMLNIGAAYVVNVGAAHALTVVGAMNTAVGLAQYEQVGMNKSVNVGRKFCIEAGDSFQVKVGNAGLMLFADGTVQLSGNNMLIEASGPIQINGKDVNIN